MTSMAALKRAIQVGTVLRVVDHWQERYIGTTRTVSKTQTNGFWFEHVDGKRHWSGYGKASQTTFHEDGSFTTDVGNGKTWTLEVIA